MCGNSKDTKQACVYGRVGCRLAPDIFIFVLLSSPGFAKQAQPKKPLVLLFAGSAGIGKTVCLVVSVDPTLDKNITAKIAVHVIVFFAMSKDGH